MMPFAPSGLLGHLGACLAVAQVLRERGHDVTFAYGGELPEMLEAEGFPWRAVPEVPAERGADSTRWFDGPDDVVDQVRARAALLADLGPDVAVTSSGAVAGPACELAGVPEVHLHHYLGLGAAARRAVAWSQRWADLRHPRRIPRVLAHRARQVRARAGGAGGRKGTGIGRTGPIAVARERLGLPPRPAGALPASPDALVACTTTPFLDPVRRLPDGWRYVGPLTWWPRTAAPPLPRGSGRPLVYVTQGSTGSAAVLRRAVAELASEPVDVLVGAGGLVDPDELRALGPRVVAQPYVSGPAGIEGADAAVVHGGHLTTTAAMRAGVPVVVLPVLRDQLLWLYRSERLGCGTGHWPTPPPAGAVGRSVRRVLRRAAYRRRAGELGARLRDGWDGAHNAAGLVDELLERG